MISSQFSQSTQRVLSEEVAVLLARLQARADDYRIAAAEAILGRKDAFAQEQICLSRELESAKQSISRGVFLISDARNDASTELAPPKWKYMGLGVTLFGDRIQRNSDAATFADVIQKIGCEKVANLGLRMNYQPLVASELRRLAHQRYHMQIEKRDEWFIVTHCSAKRKKLILDQIKHLLKVNLVAELV